MPPALLRHELPSSSASQKTISKSRHISSQIIHGVDDRLLVVAGPCSIHDPEQALEYARRLQKEVEAGRWEALAIVMRVYLSVPSEKNMKEQSGSSVHHPVFPTVRNQEPPSGGRVSSSMSAQYE